MISYYVKAIILIVQVIIIIVVIIVYERAVALVVVPVIIIISMRVIIEGKDNLRGIASDVFSECHNGYCYYCWYE